METTTTLKIAGRIALSIPFFLFSLGHFTNAQGMAMMVPGWLPGGTFWIYLTGFASLAAGISLVSGFYTKWAGLGIAALMLTYVLTIHLPNMTGAGDEMGKMMGFIGTAKDTGMLGGGLLVAAISWKN